MLQIIGWTLCAIMALKLLDLGFDPSLKDEKGEIPGGLHVGIGFGWVAAIGFAIALYVQGAAIPEF